jgi:hypothetical protein
MHSVKAATSAQSADAMTEAKASARKLDSKRRSEPSSPSRMVSKRNGINIRLSNQKARDSPRGRAGSSPEKKSSTPGASAYAIPKPSPTARVSPRRQYDFYTSEMIKPNSNPPSTRCTVISTKDQKENTLNLKPRPISILDKVRERAEKMALTKISERKKSKSPARSYDVYTKPPTYRPSEPATARINSLEHHTTTRNPLSNLIYKPARISLNPLDSKDFKNKH